ncbi:SGNH/GDSL hydrolase family protein [Gloeocapsa sp. PCC 73106]|uniref:SGNH/GDSL hydrolase family protein n=1 Tax=Gloeocapsa sp. PCC 73106 TaxID=102232 RepID=UPI0002AC15EC|nr:SGNH/GDSL hydrolase family protein [Gloeocapsa sp. PCC 73106]ELR98137.1 phospholipase/lecithinase/hemolysin [Gloeocapsa sp. PCC 73106]
MTDGGLAEFFDDYYILGDSLTDVRNFSGIAPESPIPQFNLFFDGRFTNGLEEQGGVWTDYFTDEMDLEVASFFQGGITDGTVPIVDGINFAVGGDTTASESVSGIPNLGLNNQINQFVDLVDNNIIDNLEGDLVFNWIGANDYLIAGLNEPTTVDTPAEVQSFAEEIVGNITNSLTTLLDLGAEVVVVPNMLNLGLSPLSAGNNASETLENLTLAHNQELEISLDELQSEYPDAKIIGIDLYTFFNEIFDDFEHNDRSATETNTYGTELTPVVLDPDLFPGTFENYEAASEAAEDFLWWDSTHPTTAAHALIADYFSEIIESELIITGTSRPDSLVGANGREKISGRGGSDTISGGTGNDTIYGGRGNDLISGDEGNDSLVGDAGDDTLNGGLGNDTIKGARGNEQLFGDEGDDSLSGGSGNDTLTGASGNDTLRGSSGDDQLFGEAGNDSLTGGPGNNLLNGGLGNDTLRGGPDNDQLFGEAGNDLFIASLGNDTITGGDGQDTVKYKASSSRFRFEGTPESFTVSSRAFGVDTLTNIDFVEFRDGVFAPSDLLG